MAQAQVLPDRVLSHILPQITNANLKLIENGKRDTCPYLEQLKYNLNRKMLVCSARWSHEKNTCKTVC